jgi:GNAT acetyltransferase-like protein
VNRTLLLDTSPQPAVRADTPLSWRIEPACPAEWHTHIERCGGSLFHSPIGLTVGAPQGQPLYARLFHRTEVAGIAAGVALRCGFGAWHVRFPTLPALLCHGTRDETLQLLAAELRQYGVTEVRFDSFDAAWQPGPALPSAAVPSRVEQVVPLDDLSPEQLASQFSEHHRCLVRRGVRAGWNFSVLEPGAGTEVLGRVQEEIVTRAPAAEAEPAWPAPDQLVTAGAGDPAGRWGVRVFAASEGADTLSAVLVGWAGGRAFCLQGGSTAEGLRQGAAVWLHWRAMNLLADNGCRSYNLGGVRAAATFPSHPVHAWYRFTEEFGAVAVPCRGAQWRFDRAHASVHRVAQAMSAWLQR